MSVKQKSKLKPYLHKDKVEAGCDEAGRGCLAGPVVAAAVILPQNFDHPLLNDSKQLSEKQREKLRPIIEKEALAWAVSIVDNKEVDEINVLNASITAMQRSVEQLHITPAHLLIDGNKFKPYKNIPHTCIVKGDGKYLSIAAASILAKTHRDELMEQLHEQYPGYQWRKNKGYPTKAHRAGIEKLGISPITDSHLSYWIPN
ncbi:ribonuclease HII [Saccharicrinis fermentans]|uniref:Ribonuclease HII n=1 Tax=Saccharicrinis fermentans DSM 9555 = JCM 21142 TaxID=869213 RepID=W7Y2C8_9BACT|nr:ribonuclease HII [Saccharicrinis fermentans]GAF01688.1 ribonuclease HII [Saccharicrinis fermentans DSM 9555 = JCM 21142]